jgi:hypothetical protein
MQQENKERMGQEDYLDEEDVRDQVDQDPGQRQKENQNDSKDDPLAA